MSQRVEQFGRQVHDIVSAEPGPSGRDRVRLLLEDLLRDEAFVAEQLAPQEEQRRVLYKDAELGFVVLGHAFPGPRRTKPHDVQVSSLRRAEPQHHRASSAPRRPVKLVLRKWGTANTRRGASAAPASVTRRGLQATRRRLTGVGPGMRARNSASFELRIAIDVLDCGPPSRTRPAHRSAPSGITAPPLNPCGIPPQSWKVASLSPINARP